ncbi:6-hydroxymethylpterin diphosphokinase MptE-like protein [Gloeobacter morelensis]|uniref:6-hydroxymethylpterin diphosphokinase MptE-like protein n=1 Tax=Gloeobacter morelensis TaxID=2907343 RepID=UPI001E53E50D|nr:6-hydroxymethylpterin diphosphokinase MptE-like protein [Gloeobacter morelensis]
MLATNPTVNPYRFAAYEIYNRLRWDLDIESWRSRRRLLAWKNRYAGRSSVIVCNGPSLLKSDLSLLKDTFTIGMNKINLLFERSDFRPSCIVSVNPLVLEQNADFFNQTNIPLFLDNFARRFVHPRPNVVFLHSASQIKFARDCSVSIYQGYTVTFVALQLAFHMGFARVGLIGCDHSFNAKGPANKTVVSKDQDSDHFDPNYFAGGVRWQLPDLAGSETAYALAGAVYAAAGRQIHNCTEGGRLELFTRMPLETFLQSPP